MFTEVYLTIIHNIFLFNNPLCAWQQPHFQSIFDILVVFSHAGFERWGTDLIAIPKLRTPPSLFSFSGKTLAVTDQELPYAQNKCLRETPHNNLKHTTYITAHLSCRLIYSKLPQGKQEKNNPKQFPKVDPSAVFYSPCPLHLPSLPLNHSSISLTRQSKVSMLQSMEQDSFTC